MAEAKLGVEEAEAEAIAKASEVVRATEMAISKALVSSELWAPGAEDDTVATLAQEVATAVAEALEPVFQSDFRDPKCVPRVRAHNLLLQNWLA